MTNEQMMIAILDKLEKMDTRLGRIESRLDSVESRLDRIESRLDSVESRLEQVESDVRSMKSQMEYMNGKINLLNQKTEDLKVDMKFFQKNVQKDIAKLQDGQDTVVAVLEGRGILKVNGR